MLSQNKQGLMDKFVAPSSSTDALSSSSAKGIQESERIQINTTVDVTNEVRVKNFKARIDNAETTDLPGIL